MLIAQIQRLRNQNKILLLNRKISMAEDGSKNQVKRRDVMRFSLNTIAGITIGGVTGILINNSSSEEMVWQLDPNVCIQCEKCSANCVLPFSAVKCVHSYSMCGYCDLCSGYLEPGAKSRDTGAENQLCPTGALKRTYVEEPYFEYTIDEKLCIGCGKLPGPVLPMHTGVCLPALLIF